MHWDYGGLPIFACVGRQAFLLARSPWGRTRQGNMGSNDRGTVRANDDGSIPLHERVRTLERWRERHNDDEDDRHESLRLRIETLENNRAWLYGVAAASGALIGFFLAIAGLTIGWVTIWQK